MTTDQSQSGRSLTGYLYTDHDADRDRCCPRAGVSAELNKTSIPHCPRADPVGEVVYRPTVIGHPSEIQRRTSTWHSFNIRGIEYSFGRRKPVGVKRRKASTQVIRHYLSSPPVAGGFAQVLE